MPTVSVLGAGHGTFMLDHDGAANAARLAAAITKGVHNGSPIPVNDGADPIQVPPRMIWSSTEADLVLDGGQPGAAATA